VQAGEVIRVSVAGMNPLVESNEQLLFQFIPLRENRFHVPVGVHSDDVIGQVTLKGRTPRPYSEELTVLGFRLPPASEVRDEDEHAPGEILETDEDWRSEMSTVVTKITKTELKLSDIAERLDGDWIVVANQLGLTDDTVEHIKTEYDHNTEQVNYVNTCNIA